MRSKPEYCGQLQNHVCFANFCRGSRGITIPSKSSYFFIVLWHGWSCQEMWGTILWVCKRDDSTTLKSMNSMHWWPSFHRTRIKSVKTCQKYFLKLSWNAYTLARFGRLYILWSVNKRAPSVTKWTKARDKRLNRLISYIHHTSEYKQYGHVGNAAKQCRLGLFQDSDFAGDLEDSKSTSGGTLCICGIHTIVPISYV